MKKNNTPLTFNITETHVHFEGGRYEFKAYLAKGHIYYESLVEALRNQNEDSVLNIMERLDKVDQCGGESIHHTSIDPVNSVLKFEHYDVKNPIFRKVAKKKNLDMLNFAIERYRGVEALINNPNTGLRGMLPNLQAFAKIDNLYKVLHKFEFHTLTEDDCGDEDAIGATCMVGYIPLDLYEGFCHKEGSPKQGDYIRLGEFTGVAISGVPEGMPHVIVAMFPEAIGVNGEKLKARHADGRGKTTSVVLKSFVVLDVLNDWSLANVQN